MLHVIGGFAREWGGPSQVVREMAAALAAQGLRVSVLATDAAPGGRRVTHAEDPTLGYRVHLARADWLRSPYPSLALLRALRTEARAADIVHVHGLFSAPVTSAMGLLRWLGTPYLVRTCGMLDAYSLAQNARLKRVYYHALERPNLRAARALQVSTAHEEDAVRSLALGVPIVRLAQGVAPGPPAPPASRQRAPYVLFLGRLARKKGVPLLLDALAHPVAPAVDLVLAGPDEHGHAAELDRQIAALGLGARVHRVGVVSDRAKAAWIAHAAALALPSYDENFGVVVVEAAHYGTPVVVSPEVGLAPDVLADGAGLVAPRTPEALARALSEVVTRGRHAYAPGLATFAARFSWGPIAQSLTRLYEDLIREAPPR